MALRESDRLPHEPRRRRWPWTLVVLLALALLLTAAYVFRTPILTGAARLLIVNDPPAQADIIFLLNGDFNTRPFRAAELYKQGAAPLVVIARCEDYPAVRAGVIPNDTDVSLAILKKQGVPAAKIVVLPFPGGVTSTFDEARALAQYASEEGLQRVVIVTSEFHSRRSRWIFERELAGLGVSLSMSAVPNGSYSAGNWWQNEDGLIALNNEYIKLFFYFVKYR
jgi:uncharacterized SAM-binding protein YcdF (DUF218 family)